MRFSFGFPNESIFGEAKIQPLLTKELCKSLHRIGVIGHATRLSTAMHRQNTIAHIYAFQRD